MPAARFQRLRRALDPFGGRSTLASLPLPTSSDDVFPDPMRRAASLSFLLLRETDPTRLRERIVADTLRLFRADAVRLFEPDTASGELRLTQSLGGDLLPASALVLEELLATNAVRAGKSLLSTHSRLYPALQPLAEQCAHDGVILQALLVRANSETHGVAVAYWLEKKRPQYDERSAFYLFWDNVGLALATSNERQRVRRELLELEQLAFRDELTGLPNQRALNTELDRRLEPGSSPVTVLHVDFDGMREANNSPLGYEAGGDFLIRTVGQAIPTLLSREDFTARLHRAGDEFACVLETGADGQARAAELESRLDRLEVPETHRDFYGGASVGWAVSQPGDTPSTLIARAAELMRERKRERHRQSRPS
jgi:diguanylate cyclase (GGDEF)-like protein